MIFHNLNAKVITRPKQLVEAPFLRYMQDQVIVPVEDRYNVPNAYSTNLGFSPAKLYFLHGIVLTGTRRFNHCDVE